MAASRTAPGNWDEFLTACKATTKPPERYGLGIWGRQGPAIVGGFSPFLRGNGGDYFDPETWEILINNDKAVEALEYYGDLMTKYKVIVPDAITWEFDEIVAGGQHDRYAMTITLAPYGTLINDPKLSQTAGRWAWAVAARTSFRCRKLHLDGRLDIQRAKGWQEPGMGVRVHSDGLRQAMDATLAGTRQRAAARVGPERAHGRGTFRLGAGAGRRQ